MVYAVRIPTDEGDQQDEERGPVVIAVVGLVLIGVALAAVVAVVFMDDRGEG